MKKLIHHKDPKIIHTDLPEFTGDGVHDKDGNLKRSGGGPPKDYYETVHNTIDLVKNTTLGKLNKLLDKEKKALEAETKKLTNLKVNSEQDALKAIKIDEKIIKDQAVINKQENDLNNIQNKLKDAEKNV